MSLSWLISPLLSRIVLLLCPLYQLNTLEAESTPLGGEKQNLLEKLSTKLTRQLEETIIIPASHHKDKSYLVTLPVLNKIALSKEVIVDKEKETFKYWSANRQEEAKDC
ncbi:hypothetical protein C8J55DRAFT_490976 [Lentinula edodes]|uniref:Uncharacterized protein n=1 Tax=Lentinula lateritia TaxID=40482 RepID=A0A9W9A228_9AGAR|nr:hypothetical protein C8J55DRAFT_490976 [Lentinula edodes]